VDKAKGKAMTRQETLFERWHIPIAFFFFFGGVAASAFGVIVAIGGSPVSPEVYGPLVYSIPAWGWVTMQIAFCFGGAACALLRLRRATFCFGLAFSCLMVCFSAMAIQAGATGVVMVANAGLWGAPLGFLSCFVCLEGGRIVRR